MGSDLQTSLVSRRLSPWGAFFARYSWVIVKNAVGWLLILLSLPAAISLPIPLATPMFLIGFALITFPGKRRVTSRVLRGIPIHLRSPRLRWGMAIFALVFPPLAVWLFSRSAHSMYHPRHLGAPATVALYGIAITGSWLAGWLGLRAINLLLRFAPRVRRKIRPWLRRKGIKLLPPRRKRKFWWSPPPPQSEEIIEIDSARFERAQQMIRNVPEEGHRLLTMIRRNAKQIIGVVITAGILLWMFKPIVGRWPAVHDRVMATSFLRFMLAAVMFAAFLFVFRVTSWRTILAALGHKLPIAASARIWSTSELARYLPGVIWQVVGRVYLVRPYGVNAATCSTSQVLELAIFLLSNLLLALLCLPWYAGRLSHASHLAIWLGTAMAPLLLLLLHPKIFYGGINSILLRLGKAPIANRLSGLGLLALVGWAIVGLLWQGLAIWILLGQPQALNLRLDQLGLVVGAYCLAWCAGFLAVWAPGGVGMREFVLVLILEFALPEELRNQFVSAGAYKLFLSFLAVLLRLWTIVGELLLSSLAHAFDYRGALGLPGAPGRVGPPLSPTPPERRGFEVMAGQQR